MSRRWRPDDRKRAQVTLHVSRDLRVALEAEAERSGRSLSAVAELWLEQARVLHKLRAVAPGTSLGGNKKGAEAPLDQPVFPGF